MSFSHYNCQHLNEIVDEREGTIICYDCGLVISSVYFSQPQPQQTFINSGVYSGVHDEIKEFLERLHLPQCFSDDIYNNLQISNKINSRKKGLIPYFVYKTLNEIGFPISIKDISAVSGMTENDIYSMQEDEKSLILNPYSLLEKYCKILGLNDFKTYSVIKENLPTIETGHNPLTVIASTIYKYCKQNGLKFSMKHIASTVGISSVSIQRYIRKC
jgi:transcription initiation factor TFIIIB Brf1 subunit/transcription initiation factor TFIIB